MVLNKIEDLVKVAGFYSDLSTKTRFLRDVEELIKELKGEKYDIRYF
jgi:hypothetical protein